MRQFEQIGDTQSICATLYGLFNFIAALLIDIVETAAVAFCLAFPGVFGDEFFLSHLISWVESLLLDEQSGDGSALKGRHDRIDRRPPGFCSIVLSGRFLTNKF